MSSVICIHAVGDDAMLKTLVYSGKPNYGFGSIAVMVKPSLYFLREPCQFTMILYRGCHPDRRPLPLAGGPLGVVVLHAVLPRPKHFPSGRRAFGGWALAFNV